MLNNIPEKDKIMVDPSEKVTEVFWYVKLLVKRVRDNVLIVKESRLGDFD